MSPVADRSPPDYAGRRAAETPPNLATAGSPGAGAAAAGMSAPPPVVSEVADALARLNEDAAWVAAVLRSRGPVRDVAWAFCETDGGSGELSVALIDSSLLTVHLTSVRGYERAGGADGVVLFSPGKGTTPWAEGGPPKAAAVAVCTPIRWGGLGTWVATALEAVGGLATDRYGVWHGCAEAAAALRAESGDLPFIGNAAGTGGKRGRGDVSGLETRRIQRAVWEVRRYGYGADVSVGEDAGAPAVVKLRTLLAVDELGMGSAARAACDLAAEGCTVQVVTSFLDGFRSASDWQLGSAEVRFKVSLLDEDGREDAVLFKLQPGLERVLNGEFQSMVLLRHAGAGWHDWDVALAQARGGDAAAAKAAERPPSDAPFAPGLCEMLGCEADEEDAEHDNLGLMALRWVRREILTCFDKCAVCRTRLPPLAGAGDAGAAAPPWLRVCGNRACVLAGREVEVAATPAHGELEAEIIRDPIVADLLVSLAFASLHVSPGIGLDPGPSCMASSATVRYPAAALAHGGGAQVLRRTKQLALTEGSYATLVGVIRTIPSMTLLYGVCAGSGALREFVTAHAHPMAFDVLEWIILTGKKLRLHLLQDVHDKVRMYENGLSVPLRDAQWQFFVEPADGGREAAFAACKARGKGTAFGFHGSALGHWHSILHNSLDYAERRNGRAGGDGVYLGFGLNISHGYTRPAEAMHWPNSVLRLSRIVAGVEFVDQPSVLVTNCALYCVVRDAASVRVRRLFCAGDADQGGVLSLFQMAGSALSRAPAEAAPHEEGSSMYSTARRLRSRLLARHASEGGDDEARLARSKVVEFARYTQVRPGGMRWDVGATTEKTWRCEDGWHVPLPKAVFLPGREDSHLTRRRRAGLSESHTPRSADIVLFQVEHNRAGLHERSALVSAQSTTAPLKRRHVST